MSFWTSFAIFSCPVVFNYLGCAPFADVFSLEYYLQVQIRYSHLLVVLHPTLHPQSVAIHVVMLFFAVLKLYR